MKKIIPEQEWKVLDFELFENKPATAPFPENIVRRRELLLMAQCLLSNFEFSKLRNDKEFWGELYQKIMELYFTWRTE